MFSVFPLAESHPFLPWNRGNVEIPWGLATSGGTTRMSFETLPHFHETTPRLLPNFHQETLALSTVGQRTPGGNAEIVCRQLYLRGKAQGRFYMLREQAVASAIFCLNDAT